ncbi:unnamed protein product [Meloidogyne enterolobii]|uniref:Uncharacterized protein n=1 Tax=Meloidogyne enterolobii TaxID=390850 RepID=A0ACB0ZMZ5_MELEN
MRKRRKSCGPIYILVPSKHTNTCLLFFIPLHFSSSTTSSPATISDSFILF